MLCLEVLTRVMAELCGNQRADVRGADASRRAGCRPVVRSCEKKDIFRCKGLWAGSKRVMSHCRPSRTEASIDDDVRLNNRNNSMVQNTGNFKLKPCRS